MTTRSQQNNILRKQHWQNVKQLEHFQSVFQCLLAFYLLNDEH